MSIAHPFTQSKIVIYLIILIFLPNFRISFIHFNELFTDLLAALSSTQYSHPSIDLFTNEIYELNLLIITAADGMNIPLDDDGPRIRPPDDAYIEAVKKRSLKSANTQEIVHMIFSHLFFVLVTLAIIVLYRDYYTYWTTKAINDKFLKNKPYYHLVS